MEIKIYSQKDVLLEGLSEFKRRAENPGQIVGLSTGLDKLDDYLNGLNPRYYILAARPSIGKSAFSMQLAEHIGLSGKVTGVITLEMQAIDLAMRSVANSSGVPLSAISKGNVFSTNIDKVIQAFNYKSNANVFYAFASYSADVILKTIDKFVNECKIDFLVFDYVQLTRQEGMNRNAELDKISKVFLYARKKYNIPILVLSQLNRDNDKQNREPQLHDLRDSGSLEQDADVVLFLHKTGEDGLRGCDLINLKIAKSRNEQKGLIELDFYTSYMKFKERE